MRPALLLVDLQIDYCRAAGLQPAAGALIARAAALLAGCRERSAPVFHIWTTVSPDDDRRLPHWKKSGRWLCVAGSPGHEPPAPLRPAAGEEIIHKSGFNPFIHPALEAALRRLNCDTVLLAGIHLHTCVRTAAAESLERGWEVVVCEDAVGSNEPVYAAATARWLAERGVRFEPVTALLAGLDGVPPSGWIHRSPREAREILFEAPISSPAEIASAAAAARDAGSAWRRTSLNERSGWLEGAADRLEAAAPELARQMAIEIGKPISHGMEEARRAAGNIRDVVRRACAAESWRREAAGIVRWEPRGVVALISPWNNPVAIPAGKIAPALIFGNTMVWKPAPAATNVARRVLQMFYDAGVPRGAIQFLTGDHRAAQRLAANDHVAAVTLTGSSLAGYAIQEICARRSAPLQAELSGNNAAIVWSDGDWRHAAAQIAWGAFGFAGQRCTANRRVIVPSARAEEFFGALRLAAEKLVWGDPLESATDIGPVIHVGKRDEHLRLVSEALANDSACWGERLFASRVQEAWVKAGAYAQPALVCCDSADHPVVQEETMSPLLVMQRAEDFDHALALCNGVRHGLAAALFSPDPGLREKFLSEARAGVLKFDASTAGVDASLPFGGWKASGWGPPEHGEADRLFYTQMQAVYGADGREF